MKPSNPEQPNVHVSSEEDSPTVVSTGTTEHPVSEESSVDNQVTPASTAESALDIADIELPEQLSSVELPEELETQAEGKWLEEGLYYQGTKLPQGDWNTRDWIEIPHEHYIPISKSRLFQKLWDFKKTQEDELGFRHFLELLEAIYHFHYHKTLNELKEDYEYFSPETGEELRKGVPEDELIWRERRFLKNFMIAMMRGNFAPFNDADHKQAVEQNYLFDLAVDIRWDIYDRRLINGFLDEIDSPAGVEAREELEIETSVREFIHLPERYDERIMLFYRGIGKDQTKGLFLMQKIDLFTAHLLGFIVAPFQWLVEKLRGDEDATTSVPSLGDALSALTFGMVKSEHEEEQDEAGDKRTTIFQQRWLRRLNLQNQHLGIKDLLQVTPMQEPALERVIAVFRMKPPQPPSIIDRFPIAKRIFERLGGKTEVEEIDWNLNIKMFKHIPLADSEIIFPEKNVRMKSFDLTMLILTGLIGLIVLGINLNNPNKNVLFIIVSGLVAYAVKIFIGYRRARSNYMARMTQELYHKSLDNDIGVLQYLVDSLEDQEVKEAVLAYFFLWEAGEALTEDELDARIEAFLHEQFDELEIDFEVDDALDKVIEKEGPQPHKHIPIVEVIEGDDGVERYVAKPLSEALRIMDEKWDNFYEYNV